MKDNPDLFARQQWKKTKHGDPELREYVYEKFHERVETFLWNTEDTKVAGKGRRHG
jgi:hypothetical protein